MKQLMIYAAVFFSISIQAKTFDPGSVQKLERFAMGSCHRPSSQEPFWQTIQAEDPQFFLWAGDAYYADTKNVKKLKNKMLEVFDQKDYQAFRSEIPIIGTWDDHDYGWNNSDLNYPLKLEAQQYFLDFVEEPPNSLRRQQEGIHTAYDIGDVKVIILDVRYFRLHEVDKEDRDMLGEAQWLWLENELQNSQAKMHLIVSGTTFHVPDSMTGEHWTQYPTSYQRLADLLEGVSGVVFLSGNVHFTGYKMRKFGSYKIPEFNVSGMTHTGSSFKKFLASIHYGRGNYTFEKNYGEFRIHRGESIDLQFLAKDWLGEDLMDKRLTLSSDGQWLETQ